MLGYASERQLCVALSMQTGWPAIVLDESTIRLDVLEHVSIEWARIFSALVVFEDDRTIVVAASRPEDAIVPARELGTARGQHVELTPQRTAGRGCRRGKHGDQYLGGSEAEHGKPHLSIVTPVGGEDEHLQAQRALAVDAARNIEVADELPSEEHPSFSSGDWQVNT